MSGLKTNTHGEIWRLTFLLCLITSSSAWAETLFINDATVHTMSSMAVLQEGDILIRDGRIQSVGAGLTAPADARVIEADGRPVTRSPVSLFGPATVDWGPCESSSSETEAESTRWLGSFSEMRPKPHSSLRSRMGG